MSAPARNGDGVVKGKLRTVKTNGPESVWLMEITTDGECEIPMGPVLVVREDSDMVLVSKEALRIVRNSEGPLYRQMWAKRQVDSALEGATDAAR